MAVTVTVALLGDPAQLPGKAVRIEEELKPSWDELPKVEVEADQDEPIGAVLQRAADGPGLGLAGRHMFGDTPLVQSLGFAAFYDEGKPLALQDEITTLDEQGRAKRTRNWKDVTVGEVVRAGDAGALQGDPRRPVIVLMPPAGNGVLITFVAVLWLLRELIGFAADAYTAKLAAKELMRRMRRGSDGVEGHYEQWQANGFRPEMLGAMLGQHAWSLEDVARLLGCSEEVAEGVLLGYGHVRSEKDGLWRPKDDEMGKLIAGNMELIASRAYFPQEFRELICRERMEEYLSTGRAPEMDEEELSRRLNEYTEQQERLSEDAGNG
jgi:hypothetical protein